MIVSLQLQKQVPYGMYAYEKLNNKRHCNATGFLLKKYAKENVMKTYLVSISAVFLIIVVALQAQITKEQSIGILAKKNGCFKCHSNVDNKKAIGPTFQDIAAKYKNDTLSIGALIQKVRKGGKGNWTEVSRGVPMPPYSGRLSDVEIRELVEWMLRL